MFYQNQRDYYRELSDNKKVEKFTCTTCGEKKEEVPNFNNVCNKCIDKHCDRIDEIFGC